MPLDESLRRYGSASFFRLSLLGFLNPTRPYLQPGRSNNGERPHSSLGYRTPNEFAAVLQSSVMTG